MTNKTMSSVERELLERVVDNRYREKERISIARHEALWELRAILDKDVDGDSHAPKQQAGPVAWVVFDNGFIDDHTVVKTVADEWEDRGLEVTPLYEQAKPFIRLALKPKQQGDPVAWMYEHDGMIHNDQFKPLLYVNRQTEVNEPWSEKALYAEQPAPVAAVHMVRSHGSDCWEEMSGESLEMCQAQPAEYEVRKLYAEQAAPVVTVSDLMRAIHEIEGFPGVTGDQLRELAARLNEVKP